MEERFESNNRSYLLKPRLIKQFGTQISFHRPLRRNESQYVFNSEVPAGQLIEKCRLLSKGGKEDSDYESLEEDDVPLYSQYQSEQNQHKLEDIDVFLHHWFCDGA